MLTQLMGVINITPNSFSDGEQYNSQEKFAAKFNDTLKWAQIIDIGAESTAPMNDKVSYEEELSRFRTIVFPFVEKTEDPRIILSIDTYKVEVFKEVYKKIQEDWPETRVIFNDVSGKLDDKLLGFLIEHPQVTYVFSHNLAPTREKTNQHMKYLNESQELDFVKHMVEYFFTGITTLKENKINFYIDPCFGFSKTREQNHVLLKYFKTFLLQIPYDIPCLYGVSKKSFLRFPKDLDIGDKDELMVLENMQSILLYEVIKDSHRHMIFRSHGPESLRAAQQIKNIFEL